jgi:serine/alanine adding enzyme
MTDALGHECLFHVAVGGTGRCEGVLPLVRVRSRLFGHFLMSMPFLNYGGPLGAPDAQAALIAWAIAEAQKAHVDLLELRTRHPVACDLPVSHRKLTVVRELPKSAEALWEAFPAKLRSQVRRPQKEGMEVRFGPEHLVAFYEVFARTMRDVGTPVLPRRFFERLVGAFPAELRLGVVYWQTEPVAAGCGFRWRDEFEMTWAGARRDFQRMAPNMLLYWAFMERTIVENGRSFNFGRSTPGGGTHQFKRQWGGADVALPWLQYAARPGAAAPSPDAPRYRLATAVWRRLPLRFTTTVGPTLARMLP